MKIEQIEQEGKVITYEAHVLEEEVSDAFEYIEETHEDFNKIFMYGIDNELTLYEDYAFNSGDESSFYRALMDYLLLESIKKIDVVPAFFPTLSMEEYPVRSKSYTFRFKVVPKEIKELDNYDPVVIDFDSFYFDESQLESRLEEIALEYSFTEKSTRRILESQDSCIIEVHSLTNEYGEDELEPGLYSLTLGDNLMPLSFEKQLVGMKVGEKKDFEYHLYYVDVQNKEQSITCTASITLNEIQDIMVPVIDDMWVSEHISPDLNLCGLRAILLEELKESQYRQYLKDKEEACALELERRFSGKIEDVIYKGAIVRLSVHIRQQVALVGMKWEDFLEMHGGEKHVNLQIMMQVRRNLIRGIVLDSYYFHNSLEYSDEDLLEAANRFSSTTIGTVDDIRLDNYLLEELAERICACRHLASTCTIKEW